MNECQGCNDLLDPTKGSVTWDRRQDGSIREYCCDCDRTVRSWPPEKDRQPTNRYVFKVAVDSYVPLSDEEIERLKDYITPNVGDWPGADFVAAVGKTRLRLLRIEELR